MSISLEDAIARLDEKYTLIYVAYDDKLNDEQVEHLVSGDWEALWESYGDWESDARWSGVEYVIEETFSIEEWESLSIEDQGTVRFTIEERDQSDVTKDLLSNTSNPLLRITCIDEDDSWSYEAINAQQVLDKIGFDATEHNVKVINAALNECSPEYSVIMGSWIMSVDIDVLYASSDDKDKFRITNPHLWLGNPFAGSGWLTDEPLHGSFVVDRKDIHTDKAAFGYGVDDVYGGLRASKYASQIELVESNES